MKPKIVEQAGFDVIGIEARTNNAREMSGQGVIGAHWARFLAEGILARIPGRSGDAIHALYTGYATERTGDYDYVIGARVQETPSIPPGMVLKRVPAGKYALITSEQGPAFQVVPAAWQRVWRMEDQGQLGGDRAYATDFEVYDERARNPQAAQVDIYVGVR